MQKKRTTQEIEQGLQKILTTLTQEFHVELKQESLQGLIAGVIEDKIEQYVTGIIEDWKIEDLVELLLQLSTIKLETIVPLEKAEQKQRNRKDKLKTPAVN